MADTLNSMAKGKYRTRITAVLGVESAGADQEIEIPMIAGVMSDLSGARAREQSLDQRAPVEVNGANFERFMKGVAPQIQVGSSTMTFTHMDDFSPARIAQSVPELAALLEIRKKLGDLESKLQGKPSTERQLGSMLDELRKKLPSSR